MTIPPKDNTQIKNQTPIIKTDITVKQQNNNKITEK